MKGHVDVSVDRLNFCTNSEVGLHQIQCSLETEDEVWQREHNTKDARHSAQDKTQFLKVRKLLFFLWILYRV